MPSLFPETFGYVVLEAFAVGTPVVVHEGGGALYETGVLSGGGLGYRTDTELLTALRRIVHDHRLRDELAARGFAMRMGEWSEAEHLERYLELVGEARARRMSIRPIPRPHVLGRRAADARRLANDIAEHPERLDRTSQTDPRRRILAAHDHAGKRPGGFRSPRCSRWRRFASAVSS